MKTSILLLATTLVFATGCHKTQLEPVTDPIAQDVPEIQAPATVLGKWKLVRTTGGLRGMDLSAAQQGLDQHYEFQANNRCVLTTNDNATITSYSVFRATSYTKGADGDFVTITNADTYEFYFVNDSMVLSQDVRMDGTLDWYVKEQ